MKSNPVFRIIAATLALVLALSCGKEGDKAPAYTSSFKLESTLLKAGVSGGQVNVGYSIDGPVAGSVAEVSTETSWLKIGAVTSEGFELVISANGGGSDRAGKVTLTCEGVKPVTMHVLQSKESDSEPFYSRFEISTKNETSSSVDVEITPRDPSAYYYANIVSKAQFDYYGADGIVSAFVQTVEYMASMMGDNDPRLLLNRGYYSSATDESASIDLSDNTEYYVVAVDMDFDEAGSVVTSGNAEFYKFRTRMASQVDMTFDIKVNGSVVEIVPSAGYTYVCGLASKASWDEYKDPKDVARQYISTAKSYDMLDQIVYSGRQSLSLSSSIDSSGEYVVYAVGYRKADTDSGLTTDISYVTFTYDK